MHFVPSLRVLCGFAGCNTCARRRNATDGIDFRAAALCDVRYLVFVTREVLKRRDCVA
jgi:hypothetical protein